MKIVLNDQAIQQIESLLNDLPIKCTATAQAILNVLSDNIEKEAEPKQTKK